MRLRIAGFAVVAIGVAMTMTGASQHACATLVPNGDFEVDADANSSPDNWFRGDATNYVTNDDSNGVGTSSATLENGGDWRSSAFGVTASEQLTWSIDYKVAQGATGTFRADLRFFTGQGSDGGASGNFQGEDAQMVDVANVVPDVWHTLGPFTFNVPTGSFPPLLVPNFADVRVTAGHFGPPLAGQMWLDNITVTRIPEPAAAFLMTIASVAGMVVRRRR